MQCTIGYYRVAIANSRQNWNMNVKSFSDGISFDYLLSIGHNEKVFANVILYNDKLYKNGRVIAISKHRACLLVHTAMNATPSRILQQLLMWQVRDCWNPRHGYNAALTLEAPLRVAWLCLTTVIEATIYLSEETARRLTRLPVTPCKACPRAITRFLSTTWKLLGHLRAAPPSLITLVSRDKRLPQRTKPIKKVGCTHFIFHANLDLYREMWTCMMKHILWNKG